MRMMMDLFQDYSVERWEEAWQEGSMTERIEEAVKIEQSEN